MRTICTLVVVFSFAGISTAAWGGPPQRDAGDESERDASRAKWRRLEADAGTVRYREGYREDARDVATYLDAARSRLSWPFPELLAGAPAHIRVTCSSIRNRRRRCLRAGPELARAGRATGSGRVFVC